jgi:hypothetical protein
LTEKNGQKERERKETKVDNYGKKIVAARILEIIIGTLWVFWHFFYSL